MAIDTKVALVAVEAVPDFPPVVAVIVEDPAAIPCDKPPVLAEVFTPATDPIGRSPNSRVYYISSCSV